MRKRGHKPKKGIDLWRLKSAELGAQFELFLPEGWQIKKVKQTTKKKSSSHRKPAHKSRKV